MNTAASAVRVLPNPAKQSFYLFLELRLFTPFRNSELVGTIQSVYDNAQKFHANQPFTPK